jgi:coenzyme F420-reducing hydrogenase gamma subunit
LTRPTLGVFKFSSCDGCQLSILDLEGQLLTIFESVDVRHFLEASSDLKGGPYDIALVEGCVSTPEEAERIRAIREESRTLVAIGACATAGGLQALRNWDRLDRFKEAVYPRPEFLDSLDKALPIAAYVPVDYELRGCPVSKDQLIQLFAAILQGTTPRLPTNAVCFECKRRANVCVMVASGVPCLGPVTMDGCGAICPSFGRGCYGCFGPADVVNLKSYSDWLENKGVERSTIDQLVRGINSYSKEFKEWLETQ